MVIWVGGSGVFYTSEGYRPIGQINAGITGPAALNFNTQNVWSENTDSEFAPVYVIILMTIYLLHFFNLKTSEYLFSKESQKN